MTRRAARQERIRGRLGCPETVLSLLQCLCVPSQVQAAATQVMFWQGLPRCHSPTGRSRAFVPLRLTAIATGCRDRRTGPW